jgi:hypothetical protein
VNRPTKTKIPCIVSTQSELYIEYDAQQPHSHFALSHN